MVLLDQRVDEYIESAKPFAQPILRHIRTLIHQACPSVEETIKWGFPYFTYKGLLCHMAAFQEHCAFGFYKSSIMKDPHNIIHSEDQQGMGCFGRLTDISDLPKDDIIVSTIQEAVSLNEAGIKVSKAKGKQEELIIPDYLQEALKKNQRAYETFENFSYTKKKDYVEWLTEAKQVSTRDKRLAITIEQLSEGKSRHWKYETC